MATEFAMPVPATAYNPYHNSPSQYNLYNQSQPISPLTSSNGTPHSSPTSPRTTSLNLSSQPRQLRPPKSPMYIPAVLRPNDPPRRIVKPNVLTPPHSTDGSFDDEHDAKTIRRRSTNDSGVQGLGNISEGEISTEGLVLVTDLPTREHWKADHEASVCDETTCTKAFSYFTRRHHCRRCGNIFCDTHSSYIIPLDQDANYHPGGTRSRSCQYCYSQWGGWQKARSSRSNSQSSSLGEEGTRTPGMVCKGNGVLNGMKGVFGKGGVAESLGASVPRDWNWSTF